MYLGAPRVRAAGRVSGSVAATLLARPSAPQGEPELGEARSFFRDMPAAEAGDVRGAPRRALEAHVARLNIALSTRGRR